MSAKSSTLTDLLREDDMPIKPDEPKPASSDDTKPKIAVLPEFSRVVLSKPYNHNGLSLPAGAAGVVTDVLPQLKAYTVEFGSPYSCVETVAMWMVQPANG
jgi:hypothetical protein